MLQYDLSNTMPLLPARVVTFLCCVLPEQVLLSGLP